MSQLVRLFSFLVFLALGYRLLRPDAVESRRRKINLLLLYLIVVNLLSGVSQWDNWPFTSHTIAPGRARPEKTICITEFRGLDGTGREWPLDPYSFFPVFDSILQAWCDVNLWRLSEGERERVLGFLLDEAEEARRRLAKGEAIGFERRLGPFAAPYWWLLPRAKQVGQAPYGGLRVYSACWVPKERIEDPGRVRRVLVAEHRR